MSIFTYPAGFGKHDNVHMLTKIGNSKKPFLVVKLVCFPNTEKAYIAGINKFKHSNLQYLDTGKIIAMIKKDLNERFDYELVSTEFPKKNLKTDEIIQLNGL